MMSITISPEAEMLKDTITDLVEISNIDTRVLMETLCALVVEYADAFMERSDEYGEFLRRMNQIAKDG
jgi:hypothetical protein